MSVSALRKVLGVRERARGAISQAEDRREHAGEARRAMREAQAEREDRERAEQSAREIRETVKQLGIWLPPSAR
jgi:hypothetical protein